jgi:hypothetical protein
MSRVRVFNQAAIQNLVSDIPPIPEEKPIHLGSAESPDPRWQARDKHKQHMKDLEEQRQRRFERSQSEAKAKAAELDRQVFSFPSHSLILIFFCFLN